MGSFIEAIRIWLSKNQDMVVRKSAFILGAFMVFIALLYIIRISLRLGLI